MKKWWINVGYVVDVAVWGPFVIPGETGCFCCHQNIADSKGVKQELKDKMKSFNANFQAPSTGPINMMASSFAAMDILKYLGGVGKVESLNKRIGIWTNDLRIEEQNYAKNPKCKVCGE